ncbi:citrate lyase subunit alpha [uncultured Sulfitobacter sp.]|uniref:citrate lyase subunit alpha n=1 Tax=uncultured Sulfitobacter sp. TaxID=191468 RepID=UPI002603DC5B|nr:citrate lyase subunit alpha [uncultured Sulfitobacter sp.]
MQSDNQTARLQTLTAAQRAPSSRPLRPMRAPAAEADKQLRDLPAAFDKFGIGDGATLSFHHHYRNGDRLINAVLEEAARRGLRGLRIAPSSLFPVHAPLAAHVASGVIAEIITDYAKGPAAAAMLSGQLSRPATLQSHGGRARELAVGDLDVDVAFIGASVALTDGTCTGRGGTLPCGPLGYAMVDASYARVSVVCAHEISTDPLPHIDIPAAHVDAVLPFPDPGVVSGIASDTTIPSQTLQAARIGELAAQVIAATGAMRNGLSLQTGAGGYSLGAVPIIGAAMAERHLRGSFLSGGITGAHVALQQAGLFERIHDVQCFDGAAVTSSIVNPNHHAMSASQYANPLDSSAIVNELSVMVLGAVEVDRAFNVNVTIGGDGSLIGGPGGHPDAAQGASLTIVTTGLTAGGYAKFVENVRCVTTPGASVDVIVTDHGIAVNPARPDLLADVTAAGMPVATFDELKDIARQQATRTATALSDRPRIFIEDRRGGILDWA